MRKTARMLASTDMALAAFLGAVAKDGSDFGVDYSGFGRDFGFGADLGAALGLRPSTSLAALGRQNLSASLNPSAVAAVMSDPAIAAQQIVANAAQSQAITQERKSIMNPNAGSQVLIGGYTFGLSQSVTLSTPVALDMSDRPAVPIAIRNIRSNAPLPGFASISTMLIANVNTFSGAAQDAFAYNANGAGMPVSLPILYSQNEARVTGAYSGLLPDGGYVTATPFLFTLSFAGPSEMIAQ